VTSGGSGRRWREYAGAVVLVALTSAGCLALRSRLQTTDVAMLFLLAVVFAAARWRRGPALTATLLSIAAFDYGFVPPYYTFNVAETAYFLTFAVMLAVALVMGRLTARIREQAEESQERERRTAACYDLSRELAETTGRDLQLELISRHIGRALGGEVTVVLGEKEGERREPPWPTGGVFENFTVRVAAAWAWDHGAAAGPGTAHCAEAEACVVPLRTVKRTLGVVVVLPMPPGRIPSESEWSTANALAEQATAALERSILAERHEGARIEVEAERLRTALLSSLSHDLRTPLATIEGSATSLLQEPAGLPAEARRELAETIVEESRRMTRLVSNLLDMVRVEAGGLAVHKSWQPLEEALGVALLRLDGPLRAHPVVAHLPADLPLVPIDELLIEQVFINLLENAAKYTPPGTPITIEASAQDGAVLVEVADRGPGIPPEAREAVFRKFFRSPQADHPEQSMGAGLGLTICRGIITAHGGKIWVETPAAGGAAFRFTLPLDGPPLGAALTDVAQD
jgi:two-component system sensor histidine kinase KdpD